MALVPASAASSPCSKLAFSLTPFLLLTCLLNCDIAKRYSIGKCGQFWTAKATASLKFTCIYKGLKRFRRIHKYVNRTSRYATSDVHTSLCKLGISRGPSFCRICLLRSRRNRAMLRKKRFLQILESERMIFRGLFNPNHFYKCIILRQSRKLSLVLF